MGFALSDTTEDVAVVDEGPKPPPSEIAGLEVIEAEPVPGEQPGFDVRGVRFHVRSAIPALLAEKLAMVQRDVPKVPEGTLWGDLSATYKERFSAVRAVSYELLMSVIVPEERFEFERFCNDAEPIIEAVEQAEILGRALAAAAGRPTGPS